MLGEVQKVMTVGGIEERRQVPQPDRGAQRGDGGNGHREGVGAGSLHGRARSMQEFTFKVFEAFAAATVIYLLTNLVVVLLMRMLERRVRVPGFIGSASQMPQAGH